MPWAKTVSRPCRSLGRVLIGDGAEIGANATIDRGSAQDTVIGPGVHIDNLVQIGHNVNIGANSVIVAQAGVSGSTHDRPRRDDRGAGRADRAPEYRAGARASARNRA